MDTSLPPMAKNASVSLLLQSHIVQASLCLFTGNKITLLCKLLFVELVPLVRFDSVQRLDGYMCETQKYQWRNVWEHEGFLHFLVCPISTVNNYRPLGRDSNLWLLLSSADVLRGLTLHSPRRKHHMISLMLIIDKGPLPHGLQLSSRRWWFHQ